MDCLPDRGKPGTLHPESWSESFVGEMTSGAGFGIGIYLRLDCRTWPDSLPTELTDWLRRSSMEGQYLAAALGAFQKIRPFLHHPGAWLQI